VPESLSGISQSLPVTKAELMSHFDDWVTHPAGTRAQLQEFLADPHNVGPRHSAAPRSRRHQPAAPGLTATRATSPRIRGIRWVGVLAATLLAAACTASHPAKHNSDAPLPLQPAGEIALPGDNSRFDYSSLDTQRGLLFVAHLGASEILEVDVHASRVIRTIPNLSQVHGVLVVPTLNRVYATATGANQVVALDETTGAELARAPTGQYPDGLAYDPRRNTIWTTNESGGSETVIDAATMQPRGSIDVGGQAGNVSYDQTSDRMLVAVGANNDLAVIDPSTSAVINRVALAGCTHPHGLSVDSADRLAFVACDENATLLTVDQTKWTTVGSNPVGADPDVLAYDLGARRLYVAAESGTVTTLDMHDHTLGVTGSGHLADGAHVVFVAPDTHRSYYPVPAGSNGHPALLLREPS
jgi:DNA-binding beta-propeller fold protein YncE